MVLLLEWFQGGLIPRFSCGSIPKVASGVMAEWTKAVDCKSIGNTTAGSNPAHPTYTILKIKN